MSRMTWQMIIPEFQILENFCPGPTLLGTAAGHYVVTCPGSPGRGKIIGGHGPPGPLYLPHWSEYKNGYLGINIHYISDFKKHIRNIGCLSFNEHHTGIYLLGLNSCVKSIFPNSMEK